MTLLALELCLHTHVVPTLAKTPCALETWSFPTTTTNAAVSAPMHILELIVRWEYHIVCVGVICCIAPIFVSPVIKSDKILILKYIFRDGLAVYDAWIQHKYVTIAWYMDFRTYIWCNPLTLSPWKNHVFDDDDDYITVYHSLNDGALTHHCQSEHFNSNTLIITPVFSLIHPTNHARSCTIITFTMFIPTAQKLVRPKFDILTNMPTFHIWAVGMIIFQLAIKHVQF